VAQVNYNLFKGKHMENQKQDTSGGVRSKPSTDWFSNILRGPGGIVLGLKLVEPWPEPVDGRILLNELRDYLKRFIVLPQWAAETLALWILHTFMFHLRDVSTYIGIESPTRRCGKSTLVRLLSKLVNRAVVSSNISSPAFFRVIEDLQPTLFIDEADALLPGNDELKGILNSGYNRDAAFVWRVAPHRGEEGKGKEKGERSRDSSRLVVYSCWCPKAISIIGRLSDTLSDRCIVLRMHRKMKTEKCERLKTVDATRFKRQCVRFAMDHGEIAEAEPEIPASLNDRAADIWEPLLAEADIAGGEWPELARKAAVGLSGNCGQEGSPIGALLLDLYLSFMTTGSKRRFSRELVESLNGGGDRPWMELTKGRGVTESWLAKQLGPFGIRSRLMRIGEVVARGYLEEDFTETCQRYITKSEVELMKEELVSRQQAEQGPSTPTGQSIGPDTKPPRAEDGNQGNVGEP
jgi:putative DNA primase/helicase